LKAWLQVNAGVQANNTTTATLTTAEASVGGVELNVAITYAANTNLVYTDESGNAKVWNGQTLVDQAGDKYVVCTVTLSAKTGESYSDMGTETYYLKIANTNNRVRLGPASGTYVGADADQYAAFSFDGAATFATKTTTLWVAVSPEFTNSTWDSNKVDSSTLTIAADGWSFSASKSATATLTAFAVPQP